MTLSLRNRLLAGTVAGTAFVLLAAGMLLYWQIREQLWREFDRALAARAAVLASLVEQEGRDLEFEFDDRAMPEFAGGAQAEYFQIWQKNGDTLTRSRSLGTVDLQRPELTGSNPLFIDVSLPDGRPGRQVALAAIPRVESRRTAAEPEKILIVQARSTTDIQTALGQIRWLMVGIGLAAILLSCLALTISVRAGLRPLHQLAGKLALFRPEEPSSRLVLETTPRELTPVVDQINALLQRVEDTLQREKSFSADVAHELRTPLAGLHSTLEVSLARQRDPSAYRRDMSECLKIATQMQNMVTNLLYLARLEAGTGAFRHDRVCLHDLLSDCWQPLEDIAGQKSVAVIWNLPPLPELRSDREKLQTVFANLLENAVNYVDRNGEITISAESLHEHIQVMISNSGSCLTAAEAPRCLDRFWRGDRGRQHTGVHCGLGLPLVAKILDHLGGRVKIESEDGGLFQAIVIIHHQSSRVEHPSVMAVSAVDHPEKVSRQD